MIIVLLIQVALIAADHHTSPGDGSLAMNKRLYHTLDSLISQYDQLTAEKERRVAAIKDGVKGIRLTPEQQYDLNQRLYDEYVAYKFDSAFYYIDRNVTALRGSGDQ